MSHPAGARPSDAEETALARRIFEAQQARRLLMAASTPAQRIARLQRLKQALLARREQACAALQQDFRKHPAETELTEIQPALAELNHAMRHLHRWAAPRPVSGSLLLLGTRSRIEYEPRGVVLIMAPWNYPLALILIPLVAALAAGNCVILRPSEKVPATGAFLHELIAAAFPPEEVAVIRGGIPTADALLELPFNHFFFTGSTAIGRKVMAAAARHLASVTLELGGKSPAIVEASADVELSAERIVWGKFLNAGQTCIAPDHVLVQESVAQEFVAAADAVIRRLYGETPEARRNNASFCRMVDQVAFARVTGLIEQAVSQGAAVVTGGDSSADQRYIAPTLLTGVRPDMEIMRQEIFGPVLPILTWRTPDDLWRLAGRGPSPLALYVFSRAPRFVEQVKRHIAVGGIAVNTTMVHYANPGLPFGGIGESGVGQYHGEHGFEAFSHPRAVLEQGRFSLANFFYPPYTPRVRRLVEMVTGWVLR